MAHSSVPRLILKNPLSPHPVPHEFFTIHSIANQQYSMICFLKWIKLEIGIISLTSVMTSNATTNGPFLTNSNFINASLQAP
ncbi:hypothetical protein BpHYR1_053511 [Brachionus plicatilis]|uniref:Uncharacterized protein n=1 Tax=Brachionus plicatilis TaxID=10195 RepID=A0A3M7S6R5_BRAPC|nr:hypothetical protein BpHYR1_053511 [Brachionus plicatilis]